MLEQLKKKTIKKAIPTIIIFFIVGIALIVLQFQNLLAILKGHASFDSLKPRDVQPKVIVDATITENFGSFMEVVEKNTKTNVTRTKDLYYLIGVGDPNSMDYRYMGIKVPASDKRKMDRMAEAYYNYETVEPIRYSGTIQKMSEKEYKYFKEVFQDLDWTSEDIEENTLPYFINVGALTGGAETTVYILFGLGLLSLVISIGNLIYVLNGGKLKVFKKEMSATGLSDTEIAFDYESARVFNDSNNFRIGSKLLFYSLGIKPRLLVNDKIIWVYQQTTTHRTNGVVTGTTYELLVYTTDSKTPIAISVPNENKALEALQYIAQTIPKAIVGFSDDLSNMFRRDYQGFLNLKYNRPIGASVPIGLENLKLF